MTDKTTRGNFYEDFRVGKVFQQPVPFTVTEGHIALYTALTGDRWPLHHSGEYSRCLGWMPMPVVPDLLVFHLVFGRMVQFTSLNSPANLGYAGVRFLSNIRPGDNLTAETEVFGRRETSKGDLGIVWVKTKGFRGGQLVLEFHRWFMVNKRNPEVKDPSAEVPTLKPVVAVEEIAVPTLDLSLFATTPAGREGFFWEDYEVGEKIIHPQGMTLEESEHQMATRLYLNTARVHFNQHLQEHSQHHRRIAYGGHVMSVCHALSFDGLENVLRILAINAGSHVSPTFAGDTLFAWTEVIDKVPLLNTHPLHEQEERTDVGALRLRLIGVKNLDPNDEEIPLKVPVEGDREQYHPNVVLDLDYTVLIPKRQK